MKKQPNKFKCPFCKYGYYASESKFFNMSGEVQWFSNGCITNKKVYGCPECGIIFLDIGDK